MTPLIAFGLFGVEMTPPVTSNASGSCAWIASAEIASSRPYSRGFGLPFQLLSAFSSFQICHSPIGR